MNLNNNYEHKKLVDEEEEEEETLIINDDLFEQKDLSEEEQIIQNEIKDEELSYISDKSIDPNKNENKHAYNRTERILNFNNNTKDIIPNKINNISEKGEKIINDINLSNKAKKIDMNKLWKEVQSIEEVKKEKGKYKKIKINKEKNMIKKEFKINLSQILDNKIKKKKFL